MAAQSHLDGWGGSASSLLGADTQKQQQLKIQARERCRQWDGWLAAAQGAQGWQLSSTLNKRVFNYYNEPRDDLGSRGICWLSVLSAIKNHLLSSSGEGVHLWIHFSCSERGIC
jgi:hypothetical protein